MIERFVIDVDVEQDSFSIQQVLPIRKEQKGFEITLSLWQILHDYDQTQPKDVQE